MLFLPGTRVYVALGEEWKNKVEGLCGNYDDRQDNDFHDIVAGFYASTAHDFGNKWKTIDSCADSALEDDFDTCEVKCTMAQSLVLVMTTLFIDFACKYLCNTQGVSE